MKRTDKMAFNHLAYYEKGAPVFPFASFDVTEDSAKRGGKERHRCFILGCEGAAPTVYLVEPFGHGGGASTFARDVREVITNISESPTLYTEVFSAPNVVALKGYGFTVEAYRELVTRAYEMLRRAPGDV